MWFLLFGTLFGLLTSGVWISVALGMTGIIFMQFFGGGIAILGGAVWNSLNIYSLCTLPGFLFVGQIVLGSGLSTRIYDAVEPLTARFPGKLLHSNILLCAMFASVLGVSTANAAIVGSISIPELRRRKYDERLILGTICMAGGLGLLIPPSGAFIVYGVAADVSIAALFAAGTIPGIILAFLYMCYIGVKGKLTPSISPAGEKGLPLKATVLSLLRIWPLLFLMFSCVGPMYLGWTTPVESAGVAALCAIIVGRIFGKLNWQIVKVSLINTTLSTSMILLLILGAQILSVSVSVLGIPRELVLWIGGLQMSPKAIMGLIFLMYIIMGCFLDGLAMMLLTLPFTVPVVSGLGFDLLWFGVIMVLVIEIALVTPPVGLNLFVVQGIGGPGTKTLDIFAGAFPFLVIVVIFSFLVTLFPILVTFLPRAIGL